MTRNLTFVFPTKPQTIKRKETSVFILSVKNVIWLNNIKFGLQSSCLTSHMINFKDIDLSCECERKPK